VRKVAFGRVGFEAPLFQVTLGGMCVDRTRSSRCRSNVLKRGGRGRPPHTRNFS